MKSLTILLSVFCLLHVQLPQAFAQGNSTEQRSELNREFDFTEYNKDAADIVVGTLTLLLIALTAPLFAASCRKQVDVWPHALAGVLLIVMEGILWGTYKRTATQELKILDGTKKEYNTQVKTMQAAWEQTLEAKTWMELRLGFVGAVTALIGLTMAILLIYAIVKTAKSWGAEAATVGNCYANNDPLKNGPEKLYTQNPTIDWPMSLGDLADRFDTAGNVGDAYFINEELEGLKNGAVKSPSIKDYESVSNMEDFSEIIQGTDGVIKQAVGLLRSLGDLAIPPAHSLTAEDFAPKLAAIGIGVTGGIIGSILSGLKVTLQIIKKNAWVRIVFYTFELGLLSWYVYESDKAAKEYGRRADAYEGLYKKLIKLLEQQPGFTTEVRIPIKHPNVIRSEAESGAFNAANNHCTQGSISNFKADPTCSCREKGTCTKVKMPSMKFANFDTPKVITSSANIGESMGNNLFSGNLKGAMSDAEALGRNAAKIKEVNNKLRNLANKILVDNGKKPMNFDKMGKNMNSKISKGVRDGINSLSSSDQQSLVAAVMGRRPEVSKEKEVEPKVAATRKEIKSPKKKKGFLGFFGIGEDKKEKFAAGKDVEEKELGEYEDSSQQISKETGPSIFEIIEMRYMKSAYPILFGDE